jgi:c-di-GMP-binding flagellar brake protein YcgR
MPSQTERRNNERVPCRLVCPYELTTSVDSSTVKFSEGHGLAINCSGGGMLLLLPEEVEQRQVVEIQVPSAVRNAQSTKLIEVCWIRSIPISARVKMCLAGTRFLFEIPISS